MSDRPLILLGDQGSQHLAVPCCCDGYGVGLARYLHAGNVLQCDVGLGTSQTVIDFTSPFGVTQVTPVGEGGIGSGSGDLPQNNDGDSLDLFTTSCSMGDPAKRHLAVDAHNTRLHSDDGLCAYKEDFLHSIMSDSSAGGYGPCSSRITDHCETFAFDPPDGYIIDTRTPSNICSFDDLQERTGKTIYLDIPTQGDNRMGCSYNYRKNWDDIFWETPGEIYDSSGDWRSHQSLFNSNNIPIKRMECCIGHHILEDGTFDMNSLFDFNECPVDTTRYSFGSGTDGGTANGGVVGIAPDNSDYDDKIRAYVPNSLMCDGRSSQGGNIDHLKTPQHWCTYNMQDNFDIANYDEYYSMLNDNHCKEWLKQDSERSSVNSNYPRANAYSRKLKDFYIWISNNLANDYELKPYKYHEYVPLDTTLGLTMSNRSDFDPPEINSNFDTTNDYGKFISLLKIKSSRVDGDTDDPPLVKMFLNHADKADRHIFNENMTKFCNRRDIFNFKDYSVDANIPYNSELENTYKDLCACYWDKNIDFTPTNQTDDIYKMLHSLSSRSHSAAADQIALDLQDTLDVNRKNQCWYNGCMGNVGGITEPYKEGTTTDDDIQECPDNCIGIAFSETLLNIQNSMLTDTSIDASAQADAEVNCNQDRGSMRPAPLVSSLSELHRLVDDVEESNPETGSGTGTGTSNSDKISIIIKIAYALLALFISYKVLSFIFE